MTKELKTKHPNFELNFGTIIMIVGVVSSIATVSFTAGGILEHQKMQDRLMENQLQWVLGEVGGVRSDEERKEDWRQEELKFKEQIFNLQDKIILLESEIRTLESH
jgi:hypothetical protein